jgi:tetratricopeptide (TPR) repeat protein
MPSILLLLVFNISTLSQITAQLDEAEAYLVVNAAQSVQLLQQVQLNPEHAPALHLRRAILISRATVATNQLDLLRQALDDAFYYSNTPEFKPHITALASGVGIWLRRNQFLSEAQISLECAIKHAETERQRLTLTNSMALIARQLGHYEEAKQRFTQVINEAPELGQPHLLAMAENNLGLLALDEGKLEHSEPHFRKALKQYQLIDHRAGTISAGLNLMFYFLLRQDLQNYERIAGPTETLTNNFQNAAKQAQLLWLKTRYAQMRGSIITAEQQANLRQQFSLLEDIRAQHLVARYLASAMHIDVKDLLLEVPTTKFESNWFKQIHECNW